MIPEFIIDTINYHFVQKIFYKNCAIDCNDLNYEDAQYRK